MKTILVTGANGQLGQCIQKIATNFKDFRFVFKDSKELDITNEASLYDTFSLDNFDYCINCAAYTNVEQAEKTPELAFAVNAKGAKNLAEVCKQNRTCLIHISTDYVFDGEKAEGYLPSDVPNPINEYGKSKLLGEKYIQESMNYYRIIRTSWLYSEYGNNFYKTILGKINSGQALRITDEQSGNPTNANNLAKFILNTLQDNTCNRSIQHFCDNETMTWYQFAERIISKNNLGLTARLVKDKNYRTFAKRPKNSILINFSITNEF